jgi:hypothetical protein
MMSQDIASLKLCYLTQAIAKYAEKSSEHRESCEHCDGTGNTSMTDSEGYSWSMCCICSTGLRIAEAQKAPRWNGTSKQQGKTGLLTRPGAKVESKPDIYARGCAPDKDSVGDMRATAGDESGVAVCGGHASGESIVRQDPAVDNDGRVNDPEDIDWNG